MGSVDSLLPTPLELSCPLNDLLGYVRIHSMLQCHSGSVSFPYLTTVRRPFLPESCCLYEISVKDRIAHAGLSEGQ